MLRTKNGRNKSRIDSQRSVVVFVKDNRVGFNIKHLNKLSCVMQRDLVASYRPGVSAYVVKPVNFHMFLSAAKELGGFWALINESPPGGVKKR